MSGEFNKKHIAALGAEVHTISFHTNNGEIIFDVWEIADQEKLGAVRNAFYTDGQCAIIMLDVTSRATYDNISNRHHNIANNCDEIPIVFCGNKADVEERKVKRNDITFPSEKKLQHYEISA